MYEEVDVVLLTIPKMEVKAPLVAGPALKAVLEKDGFKVKCIDLNVEFYTELRKEHSSWWLFQDFTFIDKDLFEEAWNSHIKDLSIKWMNEIEKYNPKVIGVTVLGHWTYNMAEKLIEMMWLKFPNTKIVLGGPGTEDDIAPQLLKDEYIDAYIQGEGEVSFLEYMKGNLFYPGINGKKAQQIGDMNNLPFPDYSDYDLSKYSGEWVPPNKEPQGCTRIYVTGTRGCIKRCTFCNVGSIWPKFVAKTGATIAKELKHYVETTGINSFYFTDSLLNGNCDSLVELAEAIIEFNLDIRWKGQWIARGEKLMPEKMWDKLKEAGLIEIIIGIESGSQKTRNDMKKGVSESDIEYTFQQCKRTGIKMVPLMMVGYPTETDEDFEDNLKFWERYKKYSDTVTVTSLGTTTRVLKNTPLETRYRDEMWFDEYGHWVYRDNNMQKRIERWIRMRDEALKYGFDVGYDIPTILIKEYREITGIDLQEKYGVLKNGERAWHE